jgi:hypothetical protein
MNTQMAKLRKFEFMDCPGYVGSLGARPDRKALSRAEVSANIGTCILFAK